MIISHSDLEKICYYRQNTKPSNQNSVIYYIDFDYDDGEYKREMTKINRNLAIDAVIDGKEEEYKNRNIVENSDPFGLGTTNVISPKVKSFPLTANKFVSLEKLYEDIILRLEHLTQTPMNLKYGVGIPQSMDLQIPPKDPNLTESENHQKFFRKIISRLLSCSNLIATQGRIGPAHTAIVGTEFLEYIVKSDYTWSATPSIVSDTPVVGQLAGMNIIYSHLINPRKAILVRGGSNKDSPGMHVVNNINDGTYFMGETPGSMNKQISWFELI